MTLPFELNLSLVLAHTLLLESKGAEPTGESWALAILGTGLLQEKPDVPDFKPINAQLEQGKAVSGNVANFDAISKLASNTNSFNQSELDKMMQSVLPGYEQVKKNVGDFASSATAGVIPKDVQDQIQRSGAYKSLSGGYAGSGMQRDLVARDLGLTSLDLIGKGVDTATRWLAAAKAPTFDASSMFLTPQQQVAVTTGNTVGQFQRDWMRNQVDAQFSPGSLVNEDANATFKAL